MQGYFLSILTFWKKSTLNGSMFSPIFSKSAEKIPAWKLTIAHYNRYQFLYYSRYWSQDLFWQGKQGAVYWGYYYHFYLPVNLEYWYYWRGISAQDILEMRDQHDYIFLRTILKTNEKYIYFFNGWINGLGECNVMMYGWMNEYIVYRRV